MFPGQGSQVPGMGQDLYHEDEQARGLYATASEILGYDLLRACEDRNGELSDTTILQPAILVHSVAAWTLLSRSLPERPVVMAGHSLGELSALVCAGALDFGAAVALARHRGQLMAACPPGAMAVVFGPPADEVGRVLAESAGGAVVVANRNAHDQCVISGEIQAVAAARTALSAHGAVTRPLKVAVAAHSPLMRQAVEPFAHAVARAAIRDAAVPVVSACVGAVLSTAEDLAGSVRGQLTGCVDWPGAVVLMRAQGVDVLIEAGPKSVLRDLTRTVAPEIAAWSCDSVRAAQEVAAALSGGAVQAEADSFEEFLLAALRLIVGTPALARLSAEAFETEIRAPYARLVDQLDAVRADRVPDSHPAMEQAVRDVGGVLRAKGFTDQQSHAAIERALASATAPARRRAVHDQAGPAAEEF
ncbi:ACP S-malonyltransferase [Streptosporangium roseum]|uniref:ACP S-malonyltransferase n=1 Tax=Streptosporangium roseum TaxID=2001 RepID=UPI003316F739